MANRYWVGGTAAWDGTAGTKWALTSGGAGGQAVPTSADDVFFTDLSTGTCTISTGNTGAKSINCTGFTGTLTGTAAITVSGSVTLVAGMTYTYTGILTISATATLTSGGKTLGPTIFNLPGGTVTLADAMTTGINNSTTLTAGTLALANFTLTTGAFLSTNSNIRAISFGSGNIALTHTSTAITVLSMATASNFTWTGTGGFTRTMANTATVEFGSSLGGSASNAPNLTVTLSGTPALTIRNNSYFKNLIFNGSGSGTVLIATAGTGPINIAGNLTLASSGTYAMGFTFIASGTVTSSGRAISNSTVNGSGITVTLADAMTVGTSNTFTLTEGTLALAGFTLSTGIFSSSGTSTRSIAFGSGTIALTSTTAGTTVLSVGIAVAFTYTGTGGFTRNQAATATVEFGTTGGSSTNAPNLTVNAGAPTLSIVLFSWFKNLVFTGSTCSVSSSGPINIAGDLTLASGGTYTSLPPAFRASGTITSVGKTLGSTTVNGTGITVTLADALTLGSASILTLTSGTFTAANFNVTAVSFSSNNSNTRTLNMGSGTWTISGSGATAWNTATTTGLTLNQSTSTITMLGSSAKTFAGGGLTYYNLNQGGAGALTISGSNTFNNITNSTQPATVRFTAGTTQTVSAFGLSGTAGNLVTINSTTPGSQFTLSDASGTINAQYLAIQDSNATGGAVWNALYSTNLGNNTGWIFPGGNMFLMFM